MEHVFRLVPGDQSASWKRMDGISPVRCSINSGDAVFGWRHTTPTFEPWIARTAFLIKRRAARLSDTMTAVEPIRSDRIAARVSPAGARGYGLTSPVGARSRGCKRTAAADRTVAPEGTTVAVCPSSKDRSRASSNSRHWITPDGLSRTICRGLEEKLPEPTSLRIKPRRARSEYTAAAVFLCIPEAAATARMLGRR